MSDEKTREVPLADVMGIAEVSDEPTETLPAVDDPGEAKTESFQKPFDGGPEAQRKFESQDEVESLETSGQDMRGSFAGRSARPTGSVKSADPAKSAEPVDPSKQVRIGKTDGELVIRPSGPSTGTIVLGVFFCLIGLMSMLCLLPIGAWRWMPNPSTLFFYVVGGLGALLLIAISMSVLILMLVILAPEVLRDVRRSSVIMVVLVLCEGLCVIAVKLMDVYLAPVVMAAMLLTTLLSARVGISATFTMALIAAGLSAGSSNAYSAEMVHLILTGVVSGIVAVQYLKDKPQRVRMVIAGVIVAVVNMVVILAMSLMTSNNISGMMNNAMWSMAGGILSGLISVGFQPVFEAAFWSTFSSRITLTRRKIPAPSSASSPPARPSPTLSATSCRRPLRPSFWSSPSAV